MKKPKKLAAMLAVAMMFSAVPQAALAAEVEDTDSDTSTETVADEEAPAEEEASEDEVAPEEEEPAEEASEEEEPAEEQEEVIIDEDEETFDGEPAEADEAVIEDEDAEQDIEVEEELDMYEAEGMVINPTNFPDANFRNYVINTIKINTVR